MLRFQLRSLWTITCSTCALALAFAGQSLHAQEAAPAEEAAAAGEVAEPIPFAMNGIEAIGLKPVFDDLGLTLSGWVAQSYTYNFDSPSDRVNVLRVFDDRSNDYRFNQLVVNLDRPLSEGNSFDVGGKIELMYGTDARLIHQRGLADNIDDNTVQFDPEQFYGMVRLPVGNGVVVKFGKYVTTHGAEVIDAPANSLYSRGILFGFAIPFSHTGVQLDYALNDNWGIYYGLVRGWDVWDDNNDSFTHMIGTSFTSDDEKWVTYINFITGPERLDENTDYRTVFDITSTYHWTDAFSTTVNFDLGNEAGTGAGGVGNNWYGIAAYATYTFCPQFAATVRAEYFRDETASRVGFTSDVYEVTFGLDIHPLKDFMNLRLRPEVRWDHAAGDSPFDQGTDNDQATVAMDVILTF